MHDLILVDEEDKAIGSDEKMNAHIMGKLHRAFSIIILNSKGEILIQKRAKTKYHCPKIWANACCSHPRPGEDIYNAAHRRLMEEMGFDCHIQKLFKFMYCTKFENKLIENEIDSVFIGVYNKDPKPNKEEVMNFKWISFQKLFKEINKNPKDYAIWFKILLLQLREKLEHFNEIPSVGIKNCIRELSNIKEDLKTLKNKQTC